MHSYLSFARGQCLKEERQLRTRLCPFALWELIRFFNEETEGLDLTLPEEFATGHTHTHTHTHKTSCRPEDMPTPTGNLARHAMAAFTAMNVLARFGINPGSAAFGSAMGFAGGNFAAHQGIDVTEMLLGATDAEHTSAQSLPFGGGSSSK
jgi:hypothetical protein